MKLNPYLFFEGNATDAIDFYKTALGGEVIALNRFGDSPMPCDDDWKQKIMNARIVFGGDNVIMVSDGVKGKEVSTNGNIQLAIGLEDETRTHEIFNNLAEGGKIAMSLAKQFWGDVFGMLKDKFGVKWMVNCTEKK